MADFFEVFSRAEPGEQIPVEAKARFRPVDVAAMGHRANVAKRSIDNEPRDAFGFHFDRYGRLYYRSLENDDVFGVLDGNVDDVPRILRYLRSMGIRVYTAAEWELTFRAVDSTTELEE